MHTELSCVEVILRHPAAPSLVAIREPTYGATPLGCCHGLCHNSKSTRDHADIARTVLAAGARPEPELGDVSPEVRAVIEEWKRRA
jgi:hypothetical protein